MKEKESGLSHLLSSYEEAGHPEYKAFKWYDWLKDIGKAFGPESSSDWLKSRQERAQLLLSFLGERQRYELLDVGFNDIKHGIRDGRIALPEIDDTKYFVIYEIIRGDPEIAFWLPKGKRPAILTAASSGFLNIIVYAIQKLEEKIFLIRDITKEKAKDQLFSKLNVSDNSTNTVLGFAVQNGDAKMVSVLLGRETRLARERYLNDNHIKGGLRRGAEDVIKEVLTARPDLAKSLPELIVKAGGSHCLKMWKALKSYFQQYLKSSDDILHLAVQQKQLGIIDWLVCEYPQMATRKDKGKRIALSYNNDQAHYSRDGLVKEKIRSSIVPAIIRFHKPADSQKLLLGADGKLA